MNKPPHTLTREEANMLLEGFARLLDGAVGKPVDYRYDIHNGLKKVSKPTDQWETWNYNGKRRLSLDFSVDPPFETDGTGIPTPCGCAWSPGPDSIMMSTCAFHADLQQRLEEALR